MPCGTVGYRVCVRLKRAVVEREHRTRYSGSADNARRPGPPRGQDVDLRGRRRSRGCIGTEAKHEYHRNDARNESDREDQCHDSATLATVRAIDRRWGGRRASVLLEWISRGQRNPGVARLVRNRRKTLRSADSGSWFEHPRLSRFLMTHLSFETRTFGIPDGPHRPRRGSALPAEPVRLRPVGRRSVAPHRPPLTGGVRRNLRRTRPRGHSVGRRQDKTSLRGASEGHPKSGAHPRPGRVGAPRPRRRRASRRR